MTGPGDGLGIWITQLRKGMLEFCVLRTLEEQERYGYDIVQRLREVEAMATGESTVYPILSRLKSEGFLRVRAAPSPEGPPRRYFSLTELGQIRLREMKSYWKVFTRAIDAL